MSNSGDKVSYPTANGTFKSHSSSIETLKHPSDSDASISTQPTVPPPRDTLKSIVLVFTVTFATIINVRRAAGVTGRKRTFFEPINIDCEFFINFNNYTNNSERVRLANSTTPVDRILLSFECGKSWLSRVILPIFHRWIHPNYLGLSPACLWESGGCTREEKDIYIWSCRLGGIYLSLCILKKWAKIRIDFRLLRNVLIFFYIHRCHNPRDAEGLSRSRRRCNGSCRRKSLFCHIRGLICSNLYNNLARNSCSCVPTLSCPYSSICHIFSWSGSRGCLWFKCSRCFDRIYTVRLVPILVLTI